MQTTSSISNIVKKRHTFDSNTTRQALLPLQCYVTDVGATLRDCSLTASRNDNNSSPDVAEQVCISDVLRHGSKVIGSTCHQSSSSHSLSVLHASPPSHEPQMRPPTPLHEPRNVSLDRDTAPMQTTSELAGLSGRSLTCTVLCRIEDPVEVERCSIFPLVPVRIIGPGSNRCGLFIRCVVIFFFRFCILFALNLRRESRPLSLIRHWQD